MLFLIGEQSLMHNFKIFVLESLLQDLIVFLGNFILYRLIFFLYFVEFFDFCPTSRFMAKLFGPHPKMNYFHRNSKTGLCLLLRLYDFSNYLTYFLKICY